MWSKLIFLLHFQQLPNLGLPRFQLGNVVLVAAPGAVDTAADLVDVRGDSADGSGQLLLLGVLVFCRSWLLLSALVRIGYSVVSRINTVLRALTRLFHKI